MNDEKKSEADGASTDLSAAPSSAESTRRAAVETPTLEGAEHWPRGWTEAELQKLIRDEIRRAARLGEGLSGE